MAVQNEERIVRVGALAKFKALLAGIFLQSIEFEKSGNSLTAGVNGGEKSTIFTPDEATTSAGGYMSAADKTKLNGIATGATANVGTVTGVKVNGTTKNPSSGIVDIGTVITAHQDISGKADKSATVSTIAWDSTNKKLTKTINGTTTDVVTASTIKAGMTFSKSDVGLGSVTNDSQVKRSEMGVASGVATLGSDGKVPSSQLPSFVDDVIDLLNVTGTAPTTCAAGDMYYNTSSNKIFTATATNTWGTTGATPESGKIYVNLANSKTYRWSGTTLAVISETLALGETSSTAYRGDRGKTAYDHSQLTSGNPHGVTKSDVGLGNVGNFKAVSTVASQGLSSTEQSNARANIGAGTGSYSKPSGGIPKTDLASAVQTSLGLADTALQSHQDISGKQNKVAKLGSTTKPVYTSAAGTFAACSSYAGGTAVTLNGTSKAASTASFYAPTGAGSAGQILVSNGSGAPSWADYATDEDIESIFS